MKLWHFVALAAVLGIAYVLIKRPAVPNVGASPYTSNAGYVGLATSLANLGTKIFSVIPKAAPPGADVGTNEGTYNVGGSDVTGNTLTSDSGATLNYGTD